MADGTKIEWTDATVNAVNGCSVVSPGCTNCYAMRLAGTRLKHHPSRAGLTIDTKAGPVWNGEIRVSEKAMLEPLRWRRPRMLFWNAHGDLFHPNVPDAVIDRCFAVMGLTPQHIHQVLTKRSDRMRAYLSNRKSAAPISVAVGDGTTTDHPFNNELLPPPNVWLGVSVEDQARADERRSAFKATPAAVKFVSYEPALGPVDWTGWDFVNQIISGGESGPGARPNHPDWHRGTRDFCLPRGIAYFFKQWGAWVTEDQSPEDIVLPGEFRRPWAARDDDGGWTKGDQTAVFKVGKKAAGHLLDCVEHRAVPA